MASVPLSSLPRGATGAVVGLRTPAGRPQEQLVLRLVEIGFLPGEPVQVLARAPGSEPMAVRVGRSTFALRRFEADFIEVEIA